jgi:CRISPR-associated protein Csb1
LVSEIIAIDVIGGKKTSSRIDPLGIKAVKDVIAKTDDADVWKFVDPPIDAKKAKKAEGKMSKPSEINHGNVTPTIADGGVTFREAIQTTVLSLTQLRRLRFPDLSGAMQADRDAAGRAVIAALGLFAVTLQQEDGYQLRSRCQLVPLKAPQFEVIGRTHEGAEKFELTSQGAEEALRMALAAAEKLGLKWYPGRIELLPKPDLLKLVAYSDKAMAAAEGD